MTIFESILTTFIVSVVFSGCWGSSKNWLMLKIETNLACLNRWNTLYVVIILHWFQRRDDWFMAKFFYSLEFQGFQFELFSILELISLSILTSISLRWIVHKKLVRWRSKLCSEHFSIVPWFLLTLTFYASMGRQHTLLVIQSFFTPFRIESAHAGK